MFIFGHLGIGSKLVSPLSKKLPQTVLLIGTLIPDIIDKPLFYGLSFITGKNGKQLQEAGYLICGTRTIGHTGILLILLALLSFLKRSKLLAALVLGIASHLILDNWSDYFIHSSRSEISLSPILWPFAGWQFPEAHYKGISDNLSMWKQPFIFWGEVVGFLLLWMDYYEIKNYKIRRKPTRVVPFRRKR